MVMLPLLRLHQLLDDFLACRLLDLPVVSLVSQEVVEVSTSFRRYLSDLKRLFCYSHQVQGDLLDISFAN